MPDTPPTPLALFLAEHDVPCPNPKCGFNLRGLTGTTCPECEEPLHLTVGRPDALSHMRKWVVGAVACMAASALTSGVSWVLNLLFGSMMSFMNWQLWVWVAETLVLAIVWPTAIVMYINDTRRRNPRALPRLLFRLVVGLCLIYSYSVLLTIWNIASQHVFGQW